MRLLSRMFVIKTLITYLVDRVAIRAGAHFIDARFAAVIVDNKRSGARVSWRQQLTILVARTVNVLTSRRSSCLNRVGISSGRHVAELIGNFKK